MNDEEQALRGERARELLDNPLWAESFGVIEQELIEQWKKSPARDAEGREKLWLTLRLLHQLRGRLESVVDTGKAAQASILARAAEAVLETGRRLYGR